MIGASPSLLNLLLVIPPVEVPATEVKLDRSLVSRLRTSQRSQLLIASTISTAQALGMHVVAEGIEDQETLDILKMLKCDVAQGYLMGKPMSTNDLIDGLQKKRAVTGKSGRISHPTKATSLYQLHYDTETQAD